MLSCPTCLILVMSPLICGMHGAWSASGRWCDLASAKIIGVAGWCTCGKTSGRSVLHCSVMYCLSVPSILTYMLYSMC